VILIVDDQKETGTALERLPRYAGYEAVSVTGGAEAMAMLQVRKPSLMILDVNMPEMDGLSVLQTMRASDELRDVRVLMYTADTKQQTMAEAKRLGAVDFIVKASVSFEDLIDRISELAGERPKPE
jgi:PleD family two-component response regulator